MIEKRAFTVGDANGADKAIHRHFADTSHLRNVLVHCMKDHCRNNVGNWPTREIAAPRGARGFDYYPPKDRAIAEAVIRPGDVIEAKTFALVGGCWASRLALGT